ncbi:MAG TPA: aldo/keto reductase [Armatimonadota bacterium]|jgi:aryl-alcohol dehydrogenase-like predicted oxidoreductase
MEYRVLGRSGLTVSDIGFGSLEIGRPWGIKGPDDPGLPPPLEDVDRLLRAALDLGINFIDTAAAYEDSERRIGLTIPDRRGDFILATKFGERFTTAEGSHYDFSAPAAERFLENSLRLLKTDYVDLWQIHCGANDTQTVTSAETQDAMLKAKASGKVRFLGVSPGSVEAALATIDAGIYDTLQLTYNVFDRTMEPEVLPRAKAAGVGVIVKWPLGGGALTSKYQRLNAEEDRRRAGAERLKAVAERHGLTLPDLALRFLLSNDAVSTIIAGTRRVEHLRANAANTGYTLSPELLDEISAAVA